MNCALAQRCIIIIIIIIIIILPASFELLSLLSGTSSGKKYPGWILVMKSFIKRQWNKIGTGDEVESNGLVMVKHI